MDIIENLYHGTTIAGISKFNPFTHFGTRGVALDAIARKIVDKGEKKAILIAISLRVPETELLELEDWGTPTSQGLASALKSNATGEERVELQQVLNNIGSERRDGVKDWNENGFRTLSDLLKHKNVSIIKYRNDVEGGDNSYSFCVIDPAAITVNSQQEIELKDLEKNVARWKAFNARYRVN